MIITSLCLLCAPSNGHVHWCMHQHCLTGSIVKKLVRNWKMVMSIDVYTLNHFHCHHVRNMSNIELIYLMHQYENENEVDLFTFKMGRSSSTSSWVLPWWPAVLMVWWPTTIFHFALDCTKAESTSYKNSIMSDTVHNFPQRLLTNMYWS
jgi:hypothetical protein